MYHHVTTSGALRGLTLSMDFSDINSSCFLTQPHVFSPYALLIINIVVGHPDLHYFQQAWLVLSLLYIFVFLKDNL